MVTFEYHCKTCGNEGYVIDPQADVEGDYITPAYCPVCGDVCVGLAMDLPVEMLLTVQDFLDEKYPQDREQNKRDWIA